MKKKKVILLMSLAVFITAAAAAQTPVGQIVYLEGIVDVHRNGELIELWESDIGMELHNYDLVETGEDGVVEIELTSMKSGGSRVMVQENTAFYMEGKNLETEPQMSVSMLAGGISLKIQRLSGSEAVEVRTESAVMGVRGTRFDVTQAPEGSVLVTCDEGRVAVTDDDGGARSAQSGQVVEKQRQKGLRAITVEPGDEALYREFWVDQREEVFKAGAATFVQAYARQYSAVLKKFNEAYGKLMTVRGTLRQYGSEEGVKSLTTGEAVRIKGAVSDEVIMMRSILPLFEHNFYSLQTLERYHSQGLGRTLINQGYTSVEFFGDFRRKSTVLKRRLSEVRNLMGFYLRINSVASPFGGDSWMEEMMDTDGLFDGGSGMPSSQMPSSDFSF